MFLVRPARGDVGDEREEGVEAGEEKDDEKNTVKEECAKDKLINDESSDYESTQCEEAMAPKLIRDPGQPTQKEREEHDVTHLPFRSWCRVCLEAKGKEDPHHRVREERKQQGVPVISIDYAFMGQEG